MRITKTILTSLMFVYLLMMPGAFWDGAAQGVKTSLCLAFGECELITCNPNGTYTYTFEVKNMSNFAATEAKFSQVNPATAVIAPNPYPLIPALPPGQSRQITVTISGAGSNTNLCFAVSVHDEQNLNCCSEVNKCIKLPSCGGTTPEPAACAQGTCCAQAPKYANTSFGGQKIAAVTGWSQNQAAPALTVFDLSGANAFGTNVNSTPQKYVGPPNAPWSVANLGSVFGVAIDHLGNIYVAASSAYNSDSYPQGPGRIYKLAAGTGAISNFNAVALPNSPDPSLIAAGFSASQAYPALGNISFDCVHKQFFVTNEEDGRIYRLNFNGSVVSTFDHATSVITNNGNPEVGDQPGFAPLGERLWAVKKHNNRVYYSVVKDDCPNKNPFVKNEIWSVALNPGTGDFVPGSKQLEILIPEMDGTVFSSPTSDISFSPRGALLLAERTMTCSGTAAQCAATPAIAATQVYAHGARVLEFECTASGWRLSPPYTSSAVPPVVSAYKYNLGVSVGSTCPIAPTGLPANAAGGVDYDYAVSPTYGMWATGDYLNTAPLIYGLQGVPLTGGTVNQSALVALYGLGGFKMQMGDVAVSCPPGGTPY